MQIRSLVLAAAALSAAVVARADTFTTYYLTASGFASLVTSAPAPGAVVGTLTLDDNTFQFVSADLTVSGFPNNNGPATVVANLFPQVFVDLSQGGEFDIGLNAVPNGQPSIPLDGVFFNGGNIYDDFTSYTATLTVTPEPSSLALLGTGLLALAWARRRRCAHAKGHINRRP